MVVDRGDVALLAVALVCLLVSAFCYRSLLESGVSHAVLAPASVVSFLLGVLVGWVSVRQ